MVHYLSLLVLIATLATGLRVADFPSTNLDTSTLLQSYKIAVAAPSDRQVISNMHAERIATSPDGKTKTHHFAETPVMSTYLVAVCVGEWDTVSAISPNLRIPTTVYCPLGKGDQGMFGLKVAVDAIEYLQVRPWCWLYVMIASTRSRASLEHCTVSAP